MTLKEQTLEKLSNNGRQVTKERIYFIELCEQAGGHFNANDLRKLDNQKKDALSRATIYNSLNVFLEIGFLRRLPEMTTADYYEIRRSFHPHAYCRKCGEIIDIPFDLQEEVESWDLPFEVEGVTMNITGLCQRCYSRENT